MDLFLFIVLPFCLATSFVCSGMEAGVFTLGRWRIAQQMREGQKAATRLYRYLQNTENFLWTILVGNTVAAFVGLWIVAVALIRELPGQRIAYWAAFFGAAFAFYAFCDLLPKTLFRKFPNRLCLIMAGPFGLLHFALSPIVAMVEGIANLLLRWTGGKVYRGQVFNSRNELRLLMEETAQALTSEERTMINRVFDLQNITVRHIAIPFARVPALNASQSMREALRLFRDFPQNVLPVWTGDARQRRITGFFDLKSVLYDASIRPSDPVEKYLSPALYLDEDSRVHDALRRMQRSGQRMAVVLSRDRREMGLITLEEVLNAVFGEGKP